MWYEKQAELLREELEALLSPLSGVVGLYDLVKEALIQGKRGFGNEGAYNKPWPLLSMIVCEAICGRYAQALPATAALQLLMAAGDVFDDIEDADSSESLSARYGSAVAANAATTLLILAEKSITQLKGRGVEDRVIVRVMDAVNSYYTTACAGQHLDLCLNSEKVVTEDIYLEVTAMKSASQIECACHIGALLATANQESIDNFATFGHNLGMAAQFTNDIQGVTYGSDIVKRKITLPVIYTLTQGDKGACAQLWLAFKKPSESTLDTKQIRDLLFRTGAIHYVTIKVEHCKLLALNILAKAEKSGASTKRLKLFLE
jgi:geranylgeranyl diphosphate synthase type I